CPKAKRQPASMSRRSRGGTGTESLAAKADAADTTAKNRERMIGFMGQSGKYSSCTIRSEGRAATGRPAADPLDFPDGAASPDPRANHGEDSSLSIGWFYPR